MPQRKQSSTTTPSTPPSRLQSSAIPLQKPSKAKAKRRSASANSRLTPTASNAAVPAEYGRPVAFIPPTVAELRAKPANQVHTVSPKGASSFSSAGRPKDGKPTAIPSPTQIKASVVSPTQVVVGLAPAGLPRDPTHPPTLNHSTSSPVPKNFSPKSAKKMTSKPNSASANSRSNSPAKPSPQRRRARSLSSSMMSRPSSEFTHLFGKSWASRTSMPDSNHCSTSKRFDFRPLWTSDHYFDIPSDIFRTGRRRSPSASPCFQSQTPRLPSRRMSADLGPGTYVIPNYVDYRGSHARTGDISVACFKSTSPKSGRGALDPRTMSWGIPGPGTYDLSATDISATAQKNFPIPSAAFRSQEPRFKSVLRQLQNSMTIPPPGTYFQDNSPTQDTPPHSPSTKGSCASAFRSTSSRTALTLQQRAAVGVPGPGHYYVPKEYDKSPSKLGFGGTSPRFHSLKAPDTPPPGAYDVVW